VDESDFDGVRKGKCGWGAAGKSWFQAFEAWRESLHSDDPRCPDSHVDADHGAHDSAW